MASKLKKISIVLVKEFHIATLMLKENISDVTPVNEAIEPKIKHYKRRVCRHGFDHNSVIIIYIHLFFVFCFYYYYYIQIFNHYYSYIYIRIHEWKLLLICYYLQYFT